MMGLTAPYKLEKTHYDWQMYCKDAFRAWRRQAMRGLYFDNTYGLREAPSADYWEIMKNCFTGYNLDDEKLVNEWLRQSDVGCKLVLRVT